MSHSPVLLIGFNRPDFLSKSLASLLALGVKEIWVHLDAPRPHQARDRLAVQEAKFIVDEYRNRFDTLHFRMAENNLGCKYGPINAIDWFFGFVDNGIILEDDICISEEFLNFMKFGLREFKDNDLIWAINGWSPFNAGELRNNGWLSRYPAPWGWATWKDRWARSNFQKNYDSRRSVLELRTITNSKVSVEFERYWQIAFESVLKGFDAWDYEWFHEIWLNGGYVVAPPSRLTSNIGFTETSTHTDFPVGRAGFEISIGKNFILDPNLKPNPDLDLALDKLMFGMSYPKEEYSNLEDILTQQSYSKLSKILVPSYSLIKFMRATFILLCRVPGFRMSFARLLKFTSKLPFLSRLERNYRSRVWFT